MSSQVPTTNANIKIIKWLTFMMFMMFAMTTDAVGVIIPKIIEEFKLSLTEAGAFHYTTMIAIALAGFFLGYLADKLGRKKTIILGLIIYAISSILFVAGSFFSFFLILLLFSGLAIGIFKTGALALIGDISTSTKDHTSTMNTVEGFFAVGAIIGPAIVAALLGAGVSWKWLYVIAATICAGLLLTAAVIKYPTSTKKSEEPVNLKRTFRMMKDPYAMAFSLGLFLYVAVECAIYVWMPTLLKGYVGGSKFVAAYALSIFFIFRAAGRFMGSWVLKRFHWSWVLTVFSGAIFVCFLGAVTIGSSVGVYLLPLSGLFMSMIYPTINSKGISCFPKAKHGAVAGVLLFFTCFAAAVGPLAMGAVSDIFGGIEYGFILACVLAFLLFFGLLMNSIYDPAREMLKKLDQSEYQQAAQEG